ncbi:hypothetical protein, variant [Exophiala mesophila]|uniref:Protein-S-isoprenylcysteine O-methyltransferase n=1 Tax=Exophiala mesophila TaxID=212818 RepID=A0A0D1ZYW8_EXOME|nr:uncharacterized protein PV10_06498 [Exophiala mesophila]XP_016223593.1 hypothetical protein, variant [Exophiala mesophila]KIV92018.1 hypothetical protein PV10_06498 [Exophiala mesophila]KIV92019.1 hypothetical protein, variant [Exophiala mesophila]
MSDTASDASSPGIIHEFPREEIHRRSANNRQNGSPPQTTQAYTSTLYVHPYYLPGGKRSLSGISIRAFGLGIALGLSILLTLELAIHEHGLWRAPCFIGILAIFHYMEFDSTARYNPPEARISSFLLLSNGYAYTTAHTTAMAELLLRYSLGSAWTPKWLQFRLLNVPTVVPVSIGFVLVLGGQLVRSAAMRQAKTNFNHVVQWNKRPDHVLVKDGVYSFLRHPSYFGFFWWGIGTQAILGNRICLVLYAVILWKFFKRRITYEERHLVSFFGREYVDYRDKTPVRIPFIP